MEGIIMKYAPNNWDKMEFVSSIQVLLSEMSNEYKQITVEVKKAAPHSIQVLSIQRNQNLYDFGQLLIREQLKANLNSSTFYRVRRFIKIKTHFLITALQYNVDHRRCGLATLEFKKQLSTIQPDETILVIQVITDAPHTDIIKPESSSDYFIEYIVRVC